MLLSILQKEGLHIRQDCDCLYKVVLNTEHSYIHANKYKKVHVHKEIKIYLQ